MIGTVMGARRSGIVLLSSLVWGCGNEPVSGGPPPPGAGAFGGLTMGAGGIEGGATVAGAGGDDVADGHRAAPPGAGVGDRGAGIGGLPGVSIDGVRDAGAGGGAGTSPQNGAAGGVGVGGAATAAADGADGAGGASGGVSGAGAGGVSGAGAGGASGAGAGGASGAGAGGVSGAGAGGVSGSSSASPVALRLESLEVFPLPIGSSRYAAAGHDPEARVCASIIWDYSGNALDVSRHCGDFLEYPNFPYVVIEVERDAPCNALWGYMGSVPSAASGCIDPVNGRVNARIEVEIDGIIYDIVATNDASLVP